MRNLILILILFCSGCATVEDQYRGMYDEAIMKDTNVSVVVDTYLTSLTAIVNAHLATLGYTKVLYDDATQQLAVVAKKQSGDSEAEKIIVRYTRTDEGKMRVDLVNACKDPATREAVENDILQLAALISGN